MKQKGLLLLFVLLVNLSLAHTTEITTLSSNWKFFRGKNQYASKKECNDIQSQTVSVPLDWAIYGPFDKEIDKQTVAIEQNGEKIPSEKTGRTGALPYIGEAWYRNYFTIPHYKTGQKVFILFEGAMSEPKVFVNGQKVGEWNYGYNYFYFDITEQVLEGKQNTLAVHLNNEGLSSRWYPGAGLYRNVRLIVKNQESIDVWGTYITTPLVTGELAKVNIKTKV